MTEQMRRPSPRDFDPYADRDGQDLGQDPPPDLGLPAGTRSHLKRDPAGAAQAARIASGTPGSDATDAETPSENLRKLKGAAETAASAGAALGEALDRATAAVGQDDGKR